MTASKRKKVIKRKCIMQEYPSTTYTKPYLQELLSILKMDKEFYSAEGNYLYSLEEDKRIEYLDLAGGYGSLLLGHNHPELVRVAQNLLSDQICSNHQLSKKTNLELLCKKINDLISQKTKSNYSTIILNSGSEAVEAAIKHALLAFDCKLKAIEIEINKALMIINESYFFRNPYKALIYDSYEFNNIDEISSFLESLNNNVFNSCKPKIVASNKSFHGKTLGALSVTSNKLYRNPFLKDTSFETIYLDINTECPDNLFAENEIVILIPKIAKNGQLSFNRRSLNLIAAAIIEPVIGEGGVHVVPADFLSGLRALTVNNNIPLIFDEIQSGCFRTGLFLASFHQDVFADYYITGKSLGGGLSKISAVSIEQGQYIPEFDILHSSTFAEDDYSSFIAINSLDLIIGNKFRIQDLSDFFFSSLNELKGQYPEIIQDVRGLGLMIGISFKSMEHSSCFGIQGVYRSRHFGYLIAAYLLNEKNIRVSVTLSDSKTLRLLPSLYINKKQIDQFIKVLDELCRILKYGDFYSLISFLLPNKYQHLRPISNFSPQCIKMDDTNGCIDEVGFLLHYIDINTIRHYIPSLDVLTDDAVLCIINRLSQFSEPVLIGRNRIKSSNGKEICMTFVGLSFTSQMVIGDMRESLSNISKYQSICNKAIDLLYSLGITKIGLGQYNSIIMQNGKAVARPNLRVTTGNGYTTFTVLQKIKEIRRTRERTHTKLGVVGAGGNIARILSSMVLNQFDQIVLLARSNGNSNKLLDHAGYLIFEILKDIENSVESENSIYDQVKSFFLEESSSFPISNHNYIELWKAYSERSMSNKKIEVGTDLGLLKDCDVVIVATSDPTPFLNKSFFKKGALICDISVPLNCDDDLLEDQDYEVIKGGIVNLVNGENLYPPGLYLNKGQAFACMAETMLMGFEHANGQYSFGELLKDQVNEIGSRVLSQGYIVEEFAKEIAQ